MTTFRQVLSLKILYGCGDAIFQPVTMDIKYINDFRKLTLSQICKYAHTV